ncbi:MAG TPA: cytochrome c3 family protein [Longimicrobiales bacterium]|nr:cytochrome c3 family protein [Longimicrobiales bacterium]
MTGVRKYGLLGAAVFSLTLLGCVDEQIVYRDKPLFEDPPANAVGFLGYSNVDTKQTTCGNCHAGQQVAWKESQHADAWATLQANDHKADYCNDCHTVSGKGNVTAGETLVAYAATKDPRYQDVQCESCHGGGLEHVTNPSNFQPKASILTASDATNGCGECHSDTHHPFVEEWENSRHGEVTPSLLTRSDAEFASCAYCHEAKAALKTQFGVTAEYAEKDGTERHGITCAVCHDPHGTEFTAQLRADPFTRNVEDNLCMKCHHKRAEYEDNGRGAHSPQGQLLLGENVGWRPPNFILGEEAVYGTHASEKNPELCAGCHINKFDVTDKATGAFVVSSTGHQFQAIPCVDANGQPTADQNCTMSVRSFKACTESGCHGSEVAARSATITLENRLQTLTTEVNRLVALVPRTEFVNNDGQITPGEGARFNGTILSGDMSRGVHNPFLLEALLQSSISYLKTYYSIQ